MVYDPINSELRKRNNNNNNQKIYYKYNSKNPEYLKYRSSYINDYRKGIKHPKDIKYSENPKSIYMRQYRKERKYELDETIQRELKKCEKNKKKTKKENKHCNNVKKLKK
jgi:hypothetical protein